MPNPETITYAGRRFVLAAPVAPGCPWTWREHGTSDVHEATSEQTACLAMGAYCALQRIRKGVVAS